MAIDIDFGDLKHAYKQPGARDWITPGLIGSWAFWIPSVNGPSPRLQKVKDKPIRVHQWESGPEKRGPRRPL